MSKAIFAEAQEARFNAKGGKYHAVVNEKGEFFPFYFAVSRGTAKNK